jgi:hypothetical protein
MVDITYQMVLSTLQTIALIVGIFYYITIMRNAQRNQQTAHESRQLQLLMQFSNQRNEGDMKRSVELMNMEWEDYDDYERKYGSDFNPDNYSKRMTSWGRFNMMGLLLRRGLIDKDLLFESTPAAALQHWTKFKDVIRELRRRYNLPLYGVDFEYLAEENRKYILEKGFDPTVPDTFAHYVPEEQ